MRIESVTDSLGNPAGVEVAPRDPASRPTGETLTGKHVRLEHLSADHHTHELFEEFRAAGDALWTYMPQGPFGTEAELAKWVASVDHSTDPIFYAIIDLKSNRAVGVASYLRIDTNNRTIEVGWLTFGESLRRSRGATEAMYLMAVHAFELGFRRYEWKCNVLNAPSIAAAERLGFSFEGVFRNAVLVKGRNRDTAWFGYTDSDWPKVRAALEIWLSDSNFATDGTQNASLRDLTSPLLHSRWPNLSVTV